MSTAVSEMLSARCDVGYDVSTTSKGLKAFIKLSSKDLGDKILKAETVLRNLNAAGIVHGVMQDSVEKIVNQRIFDKNVLIAEGTPATPGKPANFEICFDTAHKIVPKEDEDGRINYKDMDFLLNADEGQVLMRKTAASEGTPGMSVFGKPIPAKPGSDKKIPVGTNTHLSEDGMELISSVSGTIVHVGSVVSIQPVTTISGDIDLATGNINCKGSLRVLKDVKSNMTVTVEGDLEILGNVEDAEIVCNGNVIVKGGFIGRGTGVIQARGNVTLKYILNQKVIAGGDVTVGGESVSGHITAKHKITFLGTNGKVVGGELSADKLIYASALGAESETTTKLRVAYNAKLMENIKTVTAEYNRLISDGERVKEALVSLYKLKLANKLTEDKMAVMKKLEAFKANLPAQLTELQEQRTKLEKIANECRHAKIVAEKHVFPGVQVQIGIKYFQSERTHGPTMFELYNDKVFPSSFDKATFEAKQREQEIQDAQEQNPADSEE